jgi:hypothetical protein
LRGVPVSLFIAVGDDSNVVGIAKILREFWSPLLGSAAVASGDLVFPVQAVAVLLAFGNENGVSRGEGKNQLRQSIGHAAGLADAPHKPFPAIGATLAEVLGLVADHLIKKDAGLIGVVVGRGGVKASRAVAAISVVRFAICCATATAPAK